MILGFLTLAAALGAQGHNQLTTLEARLMSDPENLRAGAEYRQLAIVSDEYDRAIEFFERLSSQPKAGAHIHLNLALAYVDKIPAVSAFRRISLGNKATKALTRSIELEPSVVAYAIRGMVNLRFERGFFHRTPQGVADLEEARRRAGARSRSSYLASIDVALGDGYWRLKNRTKAREVWQEAASLFPGDAQLRVRLGSPDETVTNIIDKTLDAGARVDTSLKEVFQD